MGYRLSKIYTRTGDNGTTGLGDGSRVPKTHPRVEAFGTVDELNSAIGVILSVSLPDDIRAILTHIQHELFNLGGEWCIPGHRMIEETAVTWLENTLDTLNEPLPPLKDFILPNGAPAVAYTHLARAICRRAERLGWVLALQAAELPATKPNPTTTSTQDIFNFTSLHYLNRLSDLLFVIARRLNTNTGQSETLWNKHDVS